MPKSHLFNLKRKGGNKITYIQKFHKLLTRVKTCSIVIYQSNCTFQIIVIGPIFKEAC